MITTNKNNIETYFSHEISNLNFKRIVIKTAVKKFGLTKDEAISTYNEVRGKLKKKLTLRAWTYLMLGCLFVGVGLFGTLSKTGFVFYGALLAGFGMLITSFGYFRLTLLKS